MKPIYYFHTLVILSALMLSGCDDSEVDVGMAVGAGLDAFKAVTLSDAAVKKIAINTAEYSDSKNRLAPANSPYTKRLQRLANQYADSLGDTRHLNFDFKVYLDPNINAFAIADGTIRFYSGLMDLMSDEELLFIMGHEMGHVIHDHSHNQLRLAYASSALRKGAAALNNEVGDIARSRLGGLVEQVLNAQYSQREEKEADDYGVTFLEHIGKDPKHATTALQKLASISSNHSFLSSHPDPDKRVERLKEKLGQ